MISVKEFMYRLNTLYIKKKFDEQIEEKERKK